MYSPDFHAAESRRYPPLDRIVAALAGEIEFRTVMIPHGCSDGFVDAYYGRPESMLDPEVRRCCSSLGATVASRQAGRGFNSYASSPSETMCSGSRSLSPYMKWLCMFSENRLASVDFPTASATSRISMGEAPQQTPR